MRIFLLAVLFIFCSVSYAAAQDNSTSSDDSTNLKDTTAVLTKISLYDSLRNDNPEKAVEALKESIQIARDIQFKKGEFRGLLKFGEHLEIAGKVDSAVFVFKEAQQIAKDLRSKKLETEALINIGISLSYQQKLTEVDSFIKDAIAIAEQDPIDSFSLIQCYTILSNVAYFSDKYDESIAYDQLSLSYNSNNLALKAKSMLNIGSLHFTLGNYNDAKDYFLQALETATKAEDSHRVAMAHHELGRLHVRLENYEEARSNYELALKQFEATNITASIANIKHNLAEIDFEEKKYDQAIIGFLSALKILNAIDSPFDKAYTTYKLGVTYLEKKEYSKAESYLLEAKTQYDKLGNLNMQKMVSSQLSNLYARTNNYKKAYLFLQDVKLKDDSLFLLNKAKNVEEIEEKYQNEQKQKEIELLSAENQIAALEIEKQTNFRNYLIFAAILLALLIGVIFNRYQLKAKANDKLKELDALKTNFFTNISHEFRTPLTLILSPLQKLRSQTKEKEIAKELDIIHRNANVLTALTNQLLELSKLESGSLSLSVSEENLQTFLKVLCASFESLAESQNISLITDLEDAPLVAYYDTDKVQKIINNLLSNAFKFTSHEGEVSVTVRLEENIVSIAVKDNGKGISKKDQAYIFNRFYQSKRNTSHMAGTGVGLTLAKELAQLHKGDIQLISEEGKGATFIFTFPTDKTSYTEAQLSQNSSDVEILNPVRTAEIQTETASASDGSKTQILIVEDNPDLRTHISDLLKEDYDVSLAINGKKGVESAINIIPDLIITDLMMPEMDGIELSQAIRSNETTSHIPIIFLTAKADRNTKLESLKSGADDFLVKPFDNEELSVRVENIIAQRKKLQGKFAETITLSPSKIVIESKEEAFLKKALEVVDENISNSDFSVELFQQLMGMSRMQLHRKLKALTNFSASEFIRDIRLQRAADLLIDKNLNVSEIAYSCGFNSVSYFTQCFTQKYGKNPSIYRSNLPS